MADTQGAFDDSDASDMEIPGRSNAATYKTTWMSFITRKTHRK